MKYLPFLDGKYSTAPGLFPIQKAEDQDRLIFQIDDQYEHYIANTKACRKEDINKYCLEKNLYPRTASNVNMLLATQLVKEHPATFSLTESHQHYSFVNRRTGETLRWQHDWLKIEHRHYRSLFDALCSQVQEDIAICQLEGDRDWLAAIHLSAPNHWSPADKIGRPFGDIHAIVPGMEKLNLQYFKMLVSLVQKGPFVRFAWGISTDTRLNHHPKPPRGTSAAAWQGRSIGDADSQVFVRVERQTLFGIPASNAFVFTIRTYFYPIQDLNPEEKSALLLAVESMSPDSLEYKGLTGKIDFLRTLLS